MEFFVYHRDRPGSLPLREQLAEAHWSYMDGFAADLIARGPTFHADGETPSGSVHILDLPSPAAARAFALDEPNYRAGVYAADVLVRRWRNTLGRTMWEFTGDRTEGTHYLVLGHGQGAAADLQPADQDRLIAYGPLLAYDGTTWLGTAALLQAADPEQARAVLTADRYSDIEVHSWTFGGRR